MKYFCPPLIGQGLLHFLFGFYFIVKGHSASSQILLGFFYHERLIKIGHIWELFSMMIPFWIIGLFCILPLMLCGKKEVGCWIGVGLPGVENDTCAGHNENGCLCLDLSEMSFLCCSFYLSKKDLFVSQCSSDITKSLVTRTNRGF